MIADPVIIPSATDLQGVLNGDAPDGALPAAVRRLDALRDTTRQHRRTSWTTEGCSLAGLCRTVIHFSTPTRVHSYTQVDLRIHPNRPQINTQVVTLADPGWRDRNVLLGWPWDPLRARGLMTRGLGRIPPIRGTLTQAPDEAGNDMSAGRYTPVPGRTGHPAEGTGGKGTREGSPGRRRPGLAPDVLGWPWHPRRLATARHRGHGLA
jgi:hypothetical protein